MFTNHSYPIDLQEVPIAGDILLTTSPSSWGFHIVSQLFAVFFLYPDHPHGATISVLFCCFQVESELPGKIERLVRCEASSYQKLLMKRVEDNLGGIGAVKVRVV